MHGSARKSPVWSSFLPLGSSKRMITAPGQLHTNRYNVNNKKSFSTMVGMAAYACNEAQQPCSDLVHRNLRVFTSCYW